MVAEFVGLGHLFIPFYLTITVAGLSAAVIVPRLPPLSRIKDSYSEVGCQVIDNSENEDGSLLARSFNSATEKAAKAPNFKALMKSGAENVADIWFGLMPPLMFIATAGLIIAEYTPIMQWLSLPFVPLLELLQIPEAAKAAPAMMVGFLEMFLPAVIATGIESELTRFVIISVSITQLIYMSEMGVLILKTNIPLNLAQLFIIFLVRTLVVLPICAAIAHFVIF